ncbi:hypothetical protein FRC12_004835 [Ceratobasidium sp. 428]|nr:hypothetical protein FRC12_004835 [Ceratobasidium sp. 428]
MSFSETCVRPRLLFDLSRCLKNNNGSFTSNLGKTSTLSFPYGPDCNARLDGSKVVAELPGATPRQGRNHATYDLDICLYNEDGELKWKIQDGLLGRDGSITKAAEAIPGLGFIVALVHQRNNDLDHAKRALTLSGKGLFAILFGIYAIELGRFDPSMALAVAAMSFLGTVIADLTIETRGRAWIKNKRIAADIPDRDWADTFLDGLVAGAAVGAATGIAPQAEEAASWALRTVATVPEEVAIAEFETLSMQSVLYNAPKLAREVAKAATGGVVRASPSGLQMLTARDSHTNFVSKDQRSSVTPGRYYIASSQTEYLLQPGLTTDNGKSWIQGSKGNFKDHQVWIIEHGGAGFTIKSSVSEEYVGYHSTGTETATISLVGHENAAEFYAEGNYKDGFFFLVTEGPGAGLALELEHNDNSIDGLLVKLGANVASSYQKWLLEEDCYSNTLQLYHGPISTGMTLGIRDVATGHPLKLNPPRSTSASSWLFSTDKSHTWTLEAGFNGYYLKHIPSGLYALASSQKQDVKTIPLALGHAETEFILDGSEQDGYSIVYALDPSYGLDLDNDPLDTSPPAILLWKLDRGHSRWQIEKLKV